MSRRAEVAGSLTQRLTNAVLQFFKSLTRGKNECFPVDFSMTIPALSQRNHNYFYDSRATNSTVVIAPTIFSIANLESIDHSHSFSTLFVSHFSTKIADCVCDLCCTLISLWMCSEK